MELKELKMCVENNLKIPDFLIFKYEDSDFLPHQYAKNIIKNNSYEVIYIDDLSEIKQPAQSLFFSSDDTSYINIFVCDKLDTFYDYLLDTKTIIITKKVEKSIEEKTLNNIVSFGKIDRWMEMDYILSNLEGFSQSAADELCILCNNDMHRVEKEVDKLSLFNVDLQKSIFNQFKNDGVFSDIPVDTIFDFSTAILKRDLNKISSLFERLDVIDCEPLGLVTILLNTIRNMIFIQMSSNPTPESTNIQPNRFWAIKKNYVGIYSNEKLIQMFKTLTDIDRRLKLGELDESMIVDYIFIHIM